MQDLGRISCARCAHWKCRILTTETARETQSRGKGLVPWEVAKQSITECRIVEAGGTHGPTLTFTLVGVSAKRI